MSLRHDFVNLINRLFVKNTIKVVPLDNGIIHTIPRFLHTFDFLAETIFGCHIDQFKLDYMKAEWIYSDDGANETEKVILFFHGGGYAGLAPITHRGMTTHLSKVSKCKILAIRYRKSPKYKYPAQLEDAMLAYNFLIRMGFKDISIMGDSAGGNLSLALTHKLIGDKVAPLPSSLALVSPWTDLSLSGDALFMGHIDHVIPAYRLKDAVFAFCNGIDPADSRISPLFADYSDPSFPPMMIHVGSDETLLSDSVRLHEHAKSQGAFSELKIWPKGSHVFQAWTLILPAAKQSMEELGSFIEKFRFSNRSIH